MDVLLFDELLLFPMLVLQLIRNTSSLWISEWFNSPSQIATSATSYSWLLSKPKLSTWTNKIHDIWWKKYKGWQSADTKKLPSFIVSAVIRRRLTQMFSCLSNSVQKNVYIKQRPWTYATEWLFSDRKYLFWRNLVKKKKLSV